MSYKITIVSQTGDCGKSALAFTLALESQKNRCAARIYDLDIEHQTCLDWQRDRQNFGIKPSIEVVGASSAQKAIDGEPGEFLTIYDCPSRATRTIEKIVQHVDLVIIPTPPSKKSIVLHIGLVAKLLKYISADKMAILLTRVKTENEEAMARTLFEISEINENAFGDYGVEIFNSHISEKTGYGIALNNGYGLTDTSYLSLNLSAREVVLEIMSKLIFNHNNL